MTRSDGSFVDRGLGNVVGIEDLADFRKALRELDRKLPSQVVPAALKRAGERVVLPQALREAPVGDPSDYQGRRRPAPGRMRRSVRILASQRKVRIAVGGARLPYTLPVYWGWPGHNIARNEFLDRAAKASSRIRIQQEAQFELTRGLRAVAIATRAGS